MISIDDLPALTKNITYSNTLMTQLFLISIGSNIDKLKDLRTEPQNGLKLMGFFYMRTRLKIKSLPEKPSM